jgi:peptide/nickel transport system permease protein
MSAATLLAGRAVRAVRGNRMLLLGCAWVLLLALAGLLAPVLRPIDPTLANPDAVLLPPSAAYPFGTDSNGMDILARVLHGARYAFAIALPSLAVMLAVGVPLGLLAGYAGGWTDEVLTRSMDLLRAFPTIVFALAIVAAAGHSLATIVLVIGLLDAPLFARLVRSEVLALRRGTLVESALVAGNPHWRVMLRHLLPMSLDSTAALAALRMAWAVRISATLSFVGVGLQPPTPEWGAMIRLGAEHIVTGRWWVVVFPAAALVLLVLGFNLAARGLQAATEGSGGPRG